MDILLDTDSDVIQPGRNAICILRDDIMVWAGYTVSTTPDIYKQTLAISAVGWEAYMNRRVLTTTQDFFIVDQTSVIAQTLIDEMQAGDGNIGWLTNCQASGRTRTLETIYRFEKRNIGQLMEEVASLEDGFDYGVKLAWVNNAPQLTFTTFYPKRGSRKDIPLVYFGEGKAGSNMVPQTTPISISEFAWRVHGVGRGDGYLTPESTKTNSASALVYPLFESTVSFPTIGKQSVIEEMTQAELDFRSDTITTLTIDVNPNDPVAGPDTIEVGDELPVYIDEGWWQVDTYYRCNGVGVKLEDDLERVTLTMEKPYQ